MNSEKIPIEKVQEFFDFLQGELPKGVHISEEHKPEMTPDQANSVIWFLQEITRVIPDHYEMCSWCAILYDDYIEGHFINKDDEIDEWYREIGVTKNNLKEHDGARFCSPECESRYWFKNL